MKWLNFICVSITLRYYESLYKLPLSNHAFVYLPNRCLLTEHTDPPTPSQPNITEKLRSLVQYYSKIFKTLSQDKMLRERTKYNYQKRFLKLPSLPLHIKKRT